MPSAVASTHERVAVPQLDTLAPSVQSTTLKKRPPVPQKALRYDAINGVGPLIPATLQKALTLTITPFLEAHERALPEVKERLRRRVLFGEQWKRHDEFFKATLTTSTQAVAGGNLGLVPPVARVMHSHGIKADAEEGRVQVRTEHASQAQRDQIARDTGDADEQDWGDRFAQEEGEGARAEAEDELGSFEDGMGDLNSYAFIAYVYVRDRLFIVEVNALTLQGVMAGQGRGTQCINAAVTHLPAGVNPDEVDV